VNIKNMVFCDVNQCNLVAGYVSTKLHVVIFQNRTLLTLLHFCVFNLCLRGVIAWP
jgi:hypothetical protein